MKHSLISLSFLLFCTVTSRADFRSNQPADLVIGAVDPAGQVQATDIAVDSVTQKVFVADAMKHRVLRFSSAASLQNGGLAEAVFGAADMLDLSPGLSAIKLNGPRGICVDNGGRLWVADTENHRVLRFDNAVTGSGSTAAAVVLGQPNFTTTFTDSQANHMKRPQDVKVDAAGRLWVADSGNNRVLRFDNAANRSSGVNADGVLGQPTLTSQSPGSGEAELYSPTGLTLEISGGNTVRLWVVDWYNSRIVAWNDPGTKANGAPANKLLGQTQWGGGQSALAANRLYRPEKAAIDNGGLWVADTGNNRVLYFANAGSKAIGANADMLFGQYNYTSLNVADTPGGLSYPQSVAAFAGRLWIGDSYRRIVRHENAASKGIGTDADGILGRKSFVSPSSIGNVTNLCVDPTTGKLFVADSANHRVLRFPSTASLHADSVPEAVLGQPDFTTTTSGASASKMYSPTFMVLDALGNLWVTDNGNHRVLRFANAATAPNGAAAVQVLGQTNFTASSPGLGDNRFNLPRGLAVEWGLNASFQLIIRRLWVADRNNNRVLRFDNPLSLASGSAASGVLGAPNTTNAGAGSLTASGIYLPDALSVDANGRLWVDDYGNSRLLRFDAAATKPSQGNADGVLFQPNFTTKNSATNPDAGMMTMGPNGRLYLTRLGKKDIAWIDNAASRSGVTVPDGTIGDPTVLNSVPGICVAVDAAGRLWSGNGTTLMRYTMRLESTITGYGFNAQNRFYLNIMGAGGETWTIRSSTDLQNWDTIENTTTVPGTGITPITWTASAPPNGLKKFYRLQGQ